MHVADIVAKKKSDINVLKWHELVCNAFQVRKFVAYTGRWNMRSIVGEFRSRVQGWQFNSLVAIMALYLESFDLSANNWHARIHCVYIEDLFFCLNFESVEGFICNKTCVRLGVEHCVNKFLLVGTACVREIDGYDHGGNVLRDRHLCCIHFV